MASAFTILLNDSTSEGVDATSSTVVPKSPSNKIDDLLIMQVGISLNGTVPTATTPAGWTPLLARGITDMRGYFYYRKATAVNETFPNVTISGNSDWTVASLVVNGDGVDYINGPFGAAVSGAGTGSNVDNPDLTTSFANGILLSFKLMEDRTSANELVFDIPNSRNSASVLYRTDTGGVSEGVDHANVCVVDYELNASTLVNMANWVHQADASILFSIEIVTDGTITPLVLDNSPFIDIPATDYSHGTDETWIDAIINSNTLLDGTTPSTYTFDANTDIDTVNNRITFTGHSFDSSMIVRVEDNGNTLPTGLSDGDRYFIKTIDANTIELVPAEGDIDVSGEFFVNVATYKASQVITATGSGTCLLRDCRMYLSSAGDASARPPHGSASLIDGNSGSWVGDSGYHQNWMGTSYTFNTNRDMSSEIVFFQASADSNRIQSQHIVFIDTDGDWISWRLFESGVVDVFTDRFNQIDIGDTSVQALAEEHVGTFNAGAVKHIITVAIGDNSSRARPGTGPNTMLTPSVVGSVRLWGGGENAPLDFNDLYDFMQKFNSTTSIKPSDTQYVFLQNLELGVGGSTQHLTFIDSEKSVAFPPLADGVSLTENYVTVLGIKFDLTSGSEAIFKNSQVGASTPFGFEIVSPSGATINMDGNSYILGDVTLDSDYVFQRQLFVGGSGIVDNSAEVINSSLIVGPDLAVDSGMIDWVSTTDISDSSFELDTTLTGRHGIKFSTPGTYSFDNLSFTGFGADASLTAAIYNDSGGLVTINILNGGETPTFRNGAGASTVVANTVTVTVTVKDSLDSSLVEGARVYLIADTGGDLTPGTVILNADSDSLGVVQDTGFAFTNPQPVTGRVRKGTSSPLYKTSPLSGTITSSGFDTNSFMVSDE